MPSFYRSVVTKPVLLVIFLSAFALPLAGYADSSEPAKKDTQVERLSAPLATLLKQFKPDPNAEAEIIQRNTRITIDDNLFSHSVSYVAVYINSDEAVRDYSQISIS